MKFACINLPYFLLQKVRKLAKKRLARQMKLSLVASSLEKTNAAVNVEIALIDPIYRSVINGGGEGPSETVEQSKALIECVLRDVRRIPVVCESWKVSPGMSDAPTSAGVDQPNQQTPDQLYYLPSAVVPSVAVCSCETLKGDLNNSRRITNFNM